MNTLNKYLINNWGITSLLRTLNSSLIISSSAPNGVQCYSSASHEARSDISVKTDAYKKEGVSRAMKAYMERAAAHDVFMAEQEREYETGKRHLANIMGENPETFTQDDVNRAIAYLLPSAVFEPKARPHMKPPSEVFPKRKAAEFDESGRPFHTLFYTGRPAYYELLQTITIKAEKLERSLEQLRERKAEPEIVLNLSDSMWVSKEQLEHTILDKVKDDHYSFFKRSMERLLQHPCSYLEEQFFLKYRKPIETSKKNIVEELMYTSDGIPFMTAEGKRKTSTAKVTVYGHGTGKVSINGKDILYFQDPQDREQVLFPLQFTGLLYKVDIEAATEGGGSSGEAGAIRYALSLALCSFVDPHMMERMRLAGLLTRDIRKHERNKPGQKGARAKYTWKKR